MSAGQRGRGCEVRRYKTLSTGTKAVIENLENRRLLSVTYDNIVLAQTGKLGVTAISPDVSVNDSSVVAFQATNAQDNGIYTGDGTTSFPINEINPGVGAGGNVFAQFVQINNNNLIATTERLPGPKGFVLTYNAKTGASTTIAKADPNVQKLSAVFFPAINSSGTVIYSALKSNLSDNGKYLESSNGAELNLGTQLIQMNEMEADDGTVVYRNGNLPTSAIVKVTPSLTGPIVVASSGNFSALGQSPGISADGKTIVFYGVNSKGPGIFLWNNGTTIQLASIQKDSNGKVTGPVSAFSADTRVGISQTPSVLGTPGYVTFQGTTVDGKAAIFVINLKYDIASTNPSQIAFDTPSPVVVQGQTLNNLTGTVQSFTLYDSPNVHGSIAYTATTSTGATAVVRADTARRPVLVVPGIAGSFIADPQKFLVWATDRGIDPTLLKIDPLVKTYDDTIQTLVNQGYVEGKDLFAAPYDWRLDPGPLPFLSAPDGHISGLTAASITDSNYQYGVDYLGYFLKQANEAWEKRFHTPLDSVDIICHSTGGLVSRTYIQSDAYGGTYNDPIYGNIPLPKVNNIVMAGVPNKGAVGPFNPLLDNWSSDPANALFLSKLLYAGFKEVERGGTIKGPFYNINSSLIMGKDFKPDLQKFVQLYCPCLQDLLGTFPLVDLGGLLQKVEDVPALKFLTNTLVNDLNGGADGNAFADKVNGVFIAYGMGQPTPSSVLQRTGPAADDERFGSLEKFQAIFSMADIAGGHNAAPGEVWYEDKITLDYGDGTVPLQSSELQFAKDKRFVVQGFDTTHTGLMSFADTEKFFLKSLGIPITGPISTTIAAPDKAVLGSTAISAYLDPVDAFLVDSQGRKTGYSAATGAMTQIPGSIYLGGATGLAFIFGSTPGPITLQLTGQGKPYFVQVEDSQGKLLGGTIQSGTLASGAKLNVVITPSSGGGGGSPLPPVANPDTVSVVKNTATPITELANDTDPNAGGALDLTSVKIVTAPTHGKTAINTTTGVITYTPTTGFTGADSFTYTVKDKAGLTSTAAKVSITVTAVLPPVANADTVSVTKNIATAINELTNDTDPNTGGAIDPTTVKIVTAPGHGKAVINATIGIITYTPTTGFTGPDSFTYTVKDKAGLVSNTAKVSITVAAVLPPVANADTVSVTKNIATAINELTNDTDPNTGGAIDPTTVKIVTAVAHGKTVINATTGVITYTPTTGFTGTDSFTYTVKNKAGLVSNTAKVSVIVAAPVAPTAIADTVTVAKNVATAIKVLANDTDPNTGGALDLTSVKIVTAPTHGKTAVNTTTGVVTYTPTTGYTGADSFTYTVKNKAGLTSAAAKVSITVATPATDVTSKMKIVLGKATQNTTTKHYSQTVTITNNTSAAITGPLALVLDNLVAAATLNNKGGVTQLVAPLSSPYIVLNLGTATTLAVGKSVTVTLDFLDPSNAAITYKSRVLSGAGR